MKEVKIFSYLCRGHYWRDTEYQSFRDDKALSFREMIGFEKELQPYLDQGFSIEHVVTDEDAEQFVLFLVREK